MREKKSLNVGLRLFILLNIGLLTLNGFWLWRNMGDQSKQQPLNQYQLLAKRLSISSPDDTLINFAPLRKNIQDYLAKIDGKSSLYFEYLFTGTSIRAGDNEELVAASLMKIPLVMTLYRASELGLVDLNKPVTITEPELGSDFGQLWQKGAGAKISLAEAAKLTLTESDNTAANVILDNVKDLKSPTNLDPLKEIDVDITTTPDRRVAISARSYASILKCLYLACFLNKPDSQGLLTLLTETKLDNGLTSALPPATLAAHKVGTFSNINESDCGIIYVPKRTYMLCIMIKLPGDQAKTYIKDLSTMVYHYITEAKESP